MASLKPGYHVLSACKTIWKAKWPFLDQRPPVFRSGRFTARRWASTDQEPSAAQSRGLAPSALPPYEASHPETQSETSTSEGIQAAPPLTLAQFILADHARPVPVSPSYFSRRSHFNDNYLLLQKLFRRYRFLPTVAPSQVTRVAWKTALDFKLAVGEKVNAKDYVKCIELVKRLHQIHPEMKPKRVDVALKIFKRELQPFDNVTRPIPIDRFGRALGVGRRKTSVARAWLVEGNGEVQINGRSLADAFGRVHDRESAVFALRATERIDKYNVWALVEGGGTTGQAEALTLAIAKALMAHEPALKPALRRAGCVTRDRRRVERKKHGRVKARKMPTWVKR